MGIVDDAVLDVLKQKVAASEYEVSRHLIEVATERGISRHEILEAIQTAEVIEDYPDDKYWPSCLLLGRTSQGNILHVVCSYPTRTLVKIITAYEPDTREWIDSRIRRSEHVK